MPTLESQIDAQSDDFAINQKAMQDYIDEFRAIESKVIDTAESARERYAKRGLLLPRVRLNLLLDEGAPFLELSSLAGFMMYDDEDGTSAGAGMIAGIG